MTTTTDQGVRCGNHGRDKVYHANVFEVRACYQGGITKQAVAAKPIDSLLNSGTRPSQPANADQARSEAMQRLVNQTSPFFQNRNNQATDRQLRLITDLVDEHLTRDTDKAMAESVVASLDDLTYESARLVIDAILKVKAQRRAEATKAPAAPVAKMGLVAQVMGGRDENNFCIIDEVGKARFYRISKRGKQSRRPGTWKIQERVTDMLLPRADAMLATMCQAIETQGGPQAAGLRFARLMHKCYKCGASLTDTTGNPYYAMGLGPECGAK